MLRGYEILDHKPDFELKVHAPTWADLLAEAASALSTRLLTGTFPNDREGSWHTIEVRAPDRTALLSRWLNELLFEAEAGWWVPAEVVVTEASNEHLRARVRYVTVDEPPPGLAAVTPDGIEIRSGRAGDLEATVTLTTAGFIHPEPIVSR